MNRITNKIRVRGYQSFKEFMDEMVEMFVKFRNYFQNHSQCHSKEVVPRDLLLRLIKIFSINVAKSLNMIFQ